MKTSKTLIALLLTAALALAACGSDADTAVDTAVDAVTDDSAEETTAEETTEETTADTVAETEDTEEETMEEDAMEDEAMAGDAIAVDLNEWNLVMPAAVPAGPVTYAVTNSGEFPHRIAVVRGTSYEELPLLENGAVDTEALGDDFVGDQEVNLETGEAGEVTFDLPAGDYVFFCPVAFGPNSHAAAGQVMSVSVG